MNKPRKRNADGNNILLNGWPRPRIETGKAIGLNPIRMVALIILALAGVAGGYYLGKYVNPAVPTEHGQSEQSFSNKQSDVIETVTSEYQHSPHEEPLPNNVVIDTGKTLERIELPSLDIALDTSGAALRSAAPVAETETDLQKPTETETARSFVSRTALPLGLADMQNQAPGSLPAWQRYAVPIELDDRPRVVIVIDDLGVNRSLTKRTIALPGPLTLSYLAYAEDLSRQAEEGRKLGHEIMLHVPMEPTSETIDPGPNVLLSGMAAPELRQSVSWNLDQYQKVVGINNHMGSRFTSDRAGMEIVASELASRGLLFLDSVTSPKSVAHSTVKEAGLPYAVRNIFIDHENDLESIRLQLTRIERLAKRNGTAIAIGHPRRYTLQALEEWLPTLNDKGIQLVPVSAVAQIATRG